MPEGMRSGRFEAILFSLRIYPPRVIAHGAAVICPDRDLIRLGIDPIDPCVVAGFDAECLAATAVPHDVAFFVPFRPLPIGTRDLLARHQNRRPVLVTIDVALALHRSVNHVVQILARVVVRHRTTLRYKVIVYDVSRRSSCTVSCFC